MTYQSSREILYFKIPVFIVDLVLHLSALAWWLYYLPDATLNGLRLEEMEWAMYALMTISFSLSISIFGIKLHERKISIANVLWRSILQTSTTYLVFTILVAVLYKAVPRHLIADGLLLTLPLIALWHYGANKIVRYVRHLGHNTRNVVIIGTAENALLLYKELSYGKSFTGYNIKGFFCEDEHPALPEGAERLGRIDDFFTWVDGNEHTADEIYCSLPPAAYGKTVNAIIKVCNDRFIDFCFVPAMEGYPRHQMAISQMGKVNLIHLREEPLNNVFARIFKRSFDVVFSLLFLCTLYPFVLLFVWIGTSISSPGPLYFKQKRTGSNGKSFEIYKFRSMKVNADADKLQATKDDPRKTKFGDFLRRSSIDELPQFINVLKGEMSIIGPRPHMEHHTDVYSELVDNYMVRHLAKPGITGWAQVNGCRGETKTTQEMADRVEHDIWYIENWTPMLDIEIVFRTIWQVLPGHDKQAY